MGGMTEILPSLLAIIVGSGVIVYLLSRWRAESRRHSPDAALDALGRTIKVGWQDRRRLRRVARAGGVKQPAALLLSRGLFDQAALTYTRRGGDAREIERLRSRVFAER